MSGALGQGISFAAKRERRRAVIFLRKSNGDSVFKRSGPRFA